MRKKIYGWHTLPANRRLTWGDGRLVELGVPMFVAGRPRVGYHGLHVARTPIEALSYVAGSVWCWVRGSGESAADGDLSSHAERTVLWWTTPERGEALFRKAACRFALRVAPIAWPDGIPAVVSAYLNGKDRSTAAMAAAMAAVRAAAGNAGRSSAWAARAAAMAAADAVDVAAARAVLDARAIVRAAGAARRAEYAAQNEILLDLLRAEGWNEEIR